MTHHDPSINARRAQALTRAVNQSLPPLTPVDVGSPNADLRKTNPTPPPPATRRPAVAPPGFVRDAAGRLILPQISPKEIACAANQRLRQLTPVDQGLPNR